MTQGTKVEGQTGLKIDMKTSAQNRRPMNHRGGSDAPRAWEVDTLGGGNGRDGLQDEAIGCRSDSIAVGLPSKELPAISGRDIVNGNVQRGW